MGPRWLRNFLPFELVFLRCGDFAGGLGGFCASGPSGFEVSNFGSGLGFGEGVDLVLGAAKTASGMDASTCTGLSSKSEGSWLKICIGGKGTAGIGEGLGSLARASTLLFIKSEV